MLINKYLKNESFEYENGFMLTSEVYRLGNILAHYELYKMITDLPGSVVELGVFKGNSLVQFASFRELLENEKSRSIIGFDMFGEFPEVSKYQSDKKFVEEWNKSFDNTFVSQEELYEVFEHKKLGNIELIKGNILNTLPEYFEKNPHLKISLLHIDVDVYEPTVLALNILFDKVVPGGVIVFDDYGTVEGETKAVDEFLEKNPFILKKFSFSHTKPSYLIKNL